MPKIDRDAIEPYARAVYPGRLQQRTAGYSKLQLSDAGGLAQFGAGEVTLQPGGASGLYHWHQLEDEFLYVLEGELTIIEGGQTYTLGPGESAAFKAGVKVGHTAENRSDAPVRFLEIGTRLEGEIAYYRGIDMRFVRKSEHMFETRSGEPIDMTTTPGTIDEPDSYHNTNPRRTDHD
ncbi:MAG: cupin domain-containing protein [Pseudomonadota bacterium]